MSRIFSGIQPSGSLHIGNYLGAVKNWVELQHKYESFFCIVDYHAITLPYKPDDLRARVADMALGLLAAGLDPAKCTIFVQSMVPEHTELAWIFNTLTPLGELERQTQFKEKASREESVPAGILNYPVLQAADILLYRAELVPIRARAKEIAAHPAKMKKDLAAGAEHAGSIASGTMTEVKKKMGLT